MNKIPVLGTVSRAYGFLLGEFVTIVRLTWAPLLAAAALQYYFGADILQAAVRTVQNADPSRMMETMPVQYLLGLAQFVAGIIALVALLRVVVLHDRKPGLFVYFWFGSAEIRIIAVTVLLLIASIAAIIGVGIVMGLLAAIAAAVPVMGILLLVGVVVMCVAAFWAILKLSLVAPVIVAETGLGVERSWALMRGNALRMFLIVLLTFVPLGIVSILIVSAIFGSDFPAFPDIMGLLKPGEGDTAASREAVRDAIDKWQSNLFQAYLKHWPEINVFGFVYSLISTALSAGTFGSAYVAASGKHE